MTHFRIILLCIGCIALGAFLPKPWEASVKIYTNVNDGTPLNHGQKSIQIKLPTGERFSTFGGCGPHWMMDAEDKNGMYWNSLEVQIEQFDIKNFKATK